jgi:hypothetical protein
MPNRRSKVKGKMIPLAWAALDINPGLFLEMKNALPENHDRKCQAILNVPQASVFRAKIVLESLFSPFQKCSGYNLFQEHRIICLGESPFDAHL